MKYSIFMIISAVLALLFGLGFLILPAQTLSLYGITLDVGGQFVARYLGSTFLGLAFLAWLARNAPASSTRQTITQALFVLSLLGFLVALWDVFAGAGNTLVWSTVVIYLLLTVGFGYYSYIKPNAV